MKAHVLLPVWLLLSGWTDVPQPAQSNPAHLIIYRQREFDGTPYTIKINDQKLGTLPTNRYLQMDLPPGRVKIESARDYFSENQTLQLDAQPGRTYYIKAVEEVDFLSQTLLLAPVSEAQGQREVQNIKPAAKPRGR
ncbi:DUF2846 domain-containing protein [Hymenobacter sp. DH14]|uniref:DUF2846 domain-containing protein n=1 Tax=Hymenobacter cyanobacteriorum TaxID=2926463 RepID=A0A9X1VIG0_9BACT|nr:DUF2846 domain-containing protein [Hymenobacter cyanobacteriorum]MCI1189432.1 DUF2846 domain-containing protein [Hymenobacter cyanobacteriorum]